MSLISWHNVRLIRPVALPELYSRAKHNNIIVFVLNYIWVTAEQHLLKVANAKKTHPWVAYSHSSSQKFYTSRVYPLNAFIN
jgi:hypothetical protein